MENATKALLFAGGILIVIALIAVGINFIDSTSETRKQVNSSLNSQEIAMFNSQFQQYEGKQKGSSVRSLIKLAQKTESSDLQKEIDLYVLGVKQTNYTDAIDSINNTKTYNVSLKTDMTTGYINKIEITNAE